MGKVGSIFLLLLLLNGLGAIIYQSLQEYESCVIDGVLLDDNSRCPAKEESQPQKMIKYGLAGFSVVLVVLTSFSIKSDRDRFNRW